MMRRRVEKTRKMAREKTGKECKQRESSTRVRRKADQEEGRRLSSTILVKGKAQRGLEQAGWDHYCEPTIHPKESISEAVSFLSIRVFWPIGAGISEM